MNISLTPELKEYVTSQVRSGHYTSASEVMREALRGHIWQPLAQQLKQRLVASQQQVLNNDVVLADEKFYTRKIEMIKAHCIPNSH